ncbi:uncharacterized protein PITG_06567 [Phytophthora infestans T30-4]|uniref:Uncharacterized protein n=1 Tax=Phytophthora infestans (strain T30-4) TaxID=403677 RepID=D0N555_PHYIT|nr:uncharacterized protein PITG_06567 [Phytophthora infestans T30-4]EEY70013.1 hypothetical protein PITG_06567 [Phytophthora infestans T30-4]|eukprot:XP_002998660.1 hypothetical protein PITG_06567 [Phytophthora infestans T30-4]
MDPQYALAQYKADMYQHEMETGEDAIVVERDQWLSCNPCRSFNIGSLLTIRARQLTKISHTQNVNICDAPVKAVDMLMQGNMQPVAPKDANEPIPLHGGNSRCLHETIRSSKLLIYLTLGHKKLYLTDFMKIILRVSCLHYPPNTQTVADAVRSLQALPLNHDALVIQFCEVSSRGRPTFSGDTRKRRDDPGVRGDRAGLREVLGDRDEGKPCVLNDERSANYTQLLPRAMKGRLQKKTSGRLKRGANKAGGQAANQRTSRENSIEAKVAPIGLKAAERSEAAQIGTFCNPAGLWARLSHNLPAYHASSEASRSERNGGKTQGTTFILSRRVAAALG